MSDPALRQERGDPPHPHPQKPFLQSPQQCGADTLMALIIVDRDAQYPRAFAGDARDASADDPLVADGHNRGFAAVERLDNLGDQEERGAGRVRRFAPDLDGLIEIGGVEIPDVEGAHPGMMSSEWRSRHPCDRGVRAPTDGPPSLASRPCPPTSLRKGYFRPGSLSSVGSVAPALGFPARRASGAGTVS